MNPEDAESWREKLLIEIFQGLAEHKPLQSMLVFKGARVLNELLNDRGRRSLDIDSNLLGHFVNSVPDRTVRQQTLKKELTAAVTKYFERQSPVKYSLGDVQINSRPKTEHPRGWDAYDVKFSVVDLSRPGVRSLPSLALDIAAPEALRDESIAPLKLGQATVWAYTLERIAGEKLRAFLSTLPHYRGKVKKPGEAVRVKDIFDIARIARVHPLDDYTFWSKVGDEFKLACESRFIDCQGLATFEQDLSTTQFAYEKDSTTPSGTRT